MATELENNQETLLTLAKQNFKRWNDALLTKNPEEVARLYTPNNSFLPTLSPDFHHGHQGAENYFEHFLAKNPEGIVVTESVHYLSDKAYLHSGFYDFEVGPDDQREVVHARFTFGWQLIDGEWQIFHHHSSLVPTK